MTHTVCGQPIAWVEQPLRDDLRLVVPVCRTCPKYDVPDHELSPGRPWELVDDAAREVDA